MVDQTMDCLQDLGYDHEAVTAFFTPNWFSILVEIIWIVPKNLTGFKLSAWPKFFLKLFNGNIIYLYARTQIINIQLMNSHILNTPV